jgi:hypothetical protein
MNRRGKSCAAEENINQIEREGEVETIQALDIFSLTESKKSLNNKWVIGIDIVGPPENSTTD